jgi:hypothetical protein
MSMTITPNTTIAPDGLLTADTVADLSTDETLFLRQLVEPASLIGEAFGSIHILKTTGTPEVYPALTLTETAPIGVGVVINTTTGTVAASINGGAAAVQDVGDYWRVIVGVGVSDPDAVQIRFAPAYNADGGEYNDESVTGSQVVWGAQISARNDAYQRIEPDGSFNQMVLDETIQLQDQTLVIDWYSYFFTPITPLQEFVLTDIPPYADAVITVTTDKLGGSVGIGQIVLGSLREIGTTVVDNSGFSGLDFSTVEQDEFGDLTTVRRAATRLSQFELFMNNSTLLGTDALFRSLRGGVAAVWVGDDDVRKAAVNYGYLRDYRTVYTTSRFSVLSLQIQGIV